MARFSPNLHALAPLAVLVGALGGAALGVTWVKVWFYPLLWWSYIFLVDSQVQRHAGNSLWIDRRRTFWFLAGASVVFWFAWEAVNLRLADWEYLGVPRQIWLRWPLAFLSYATVLPGVLETYELLTVYGAKGDGGLRWGHNVRPLRLGRSWRGWCLATGLAGLVLPLAWPGLFFPLVWLALFFLLEPLNYRQGLPSLMAAWERGDLSPLVRLLLAGLICGVVWESGNWPALARWRYTIPYLAEPRIFAMPLAGYLGFAPFAVECYVFTATLGLLRGGRGWEAADHDREFLPRPPAWLLWVLGLAGLAFSLVMCHLIDLYLVKSWS
ncbi:MAG: hypothetical protein KQJ78_17445 [Deltaproteobacteria bacterium]|nr:hypothetical protein [Deltaproteobacteria bacterium]